MLDASSSSASVCVLKEDKLLYESYLNNGLTHSASLMPMVEDAMRHAGVDIADIDLFGCVVGPLLGMDPGFAAAVGMVVLFCCVVNCPLASILLAVELFGGAGLSFFALTCGLAYVMSGYYSLYSEQKFIYSKLIDEPKD